MTADAFTEEQKRYLEGFVSGVQSSRVAAGMKPLGGIGGGSGISAGGQVGDGGSGGAVAPFVGIRRGSTLDRQLDPALITVATRMTDISAEMKPR